MVVRIAQVHLMTHHGHLKFIMQPTERWRQKKTWGGGVKWHPVNFLQLLQIDCTMVIPLTDTWIEERSLIAWVCSNQKQKVTLLNASDTAVQEVIGAQVSSKETKYQKWFKSLIVKQLDGLRTNCNLFLIPDYMTKIVVSTVIHYIPHFR